MSVSENRIFIELGNRPGELDTLYARVQEFGKSRGLSEKILFQINLALEELVSNIIFYGYTDEAQHRIGITVFLDEGTLNFRIEDDGIPFDPLGFPPPDLECPIEKRKIGGLGIHFVKELMDDIVYERRGDKNILVLKKKIKT